MNYYLVFDDTLNIINDHIVVVHSYLKGLLALPLWTITLNTDQVLTCENIASDFAFCGGYHWRHTISSSTYNSLVNFQPKYDISSNENGKFTPCFGCENVNWQPARANRSWYITIGWKRGVWPVSDVSWWWQGKEKHQKYLFHLGRVFAPQHVTGWQVYTCHVFD